MTVATQTIPQIQQRTREIFSLRGISWQTYKALMTEVGEDRAWRVVYDQGVLELKMPLAEHEEPKGLIESLIEAFADELEMEVRKLGALTLEREDLRRAIEPDSCFYVQSELQVRGKININLNTDPPPDLAIESDYTSSSLNKFSIYSSLGVGELWRYHQNQLQVYIRKGEGYERSDQSLAFPLFPIGEIGSLIDQSREIGQRAVVRLFRKRIREISCRS
jgi:Uma2 family endonuclease